MAITPAFAPISPISTPLPSADVEQASAAIAQAGTVSGATPAAAPAPGFADALDQVAAVEQKANTAAVDLATGKLSNPHEFTALAAQARLTVELTAAIRNRAVEAFTDVMHMQV